MCVCVCVCVCVRGILKNDMLSHVYRDPVGKWNIHTDTGTLGQDLIEGLWDELWESLWERVGREWKKPNWLG